MELIIPLTIFAGFGILIGYLIYHQHKVEKQRTEAFKAIAEGLGFGFEAMPDESVLADAGQFYLFKQGRDRKIKNMLWGTTQSLSVAIFDYEYVTGQGKHRKFHQQTVIRLLVPDFDVPTFAMRPESFLHRIGKFFGIQDINFESHPEFSRQYLLQGEDVEGIRDLFTEEILDYFEEVSGYCVEGSGQRIVLYEAGKRSEPEHVRDVLERGFEVLNVFKSAR